MLARFSMVSACIVGAALVGASSLEAAPITQAFAFAVRDNETSNTVGTGVGSTFSVGTSLVLPDASQGTTATGTNILTGTSLNFPSRIASNQPGLFGVEFSYSQAVSQNLLGSWRIVLENGSDQRTLVTPDANGLAEMGLVRTLAISGESTSPTVTWKLPASGPPVTQVRYELWDDAANTVLTGQVPVNLGATAVSLSLSSLASGSQYAIRIIAQNDSAGAITRSSNWISWTAGPGTPSGNVAELTTGSPVSLTQTVNVPLDPFNLVFDYKFLTPTGDLTVLLGGMEIGRALTAPTTPSDEFLRAFFEVDEANLLGMSGIPLTFLLDGPTGSSVLLDNIVFPGIMNGDFSSLSGWSADGAGSVSLRAVPEPSSLYLVLAGLMAWGLIVLWPYRHSRRCWS